MYFPHAATTIVTTILNSPTRTDKCILGTTGANNNNNKSKATSWPTNFKTAPDHTHRCSQAKENKTKHESTLREEKCSHFQHLDIKFM